MNESDIKNLLIPGYSTLDKRQRELFEASEAGQKFLGTVEEFTQQNNAIPLYKKILEPFFFGHNADTTELEDSIIEQKATLMALIKTSAEYQIIEEKLISKILHTFYPDFIYLSSENQSNLSKAIYSRELMAFYGPNGLCTELNYSQKTLLKQWNSAWARTDEHQAMLAEIDARKIAIKLTKLSERTKNLAIFFPLLLPEMAARLFKIYENNITNPLFCAPETELAFLTELVASHFNAACATNLAFMENELKEFNKKEAETIVKKLLNAFDTAKQFNLEQELIIYHNSLGQFIKKNLLSINGRTRPLSRKTFPQHISDALSFVFNNSQLQSANQFVSRLAEAHAFLTNTGFSSQNDNIVNTLLELYNTNRIKDEVNETKQILGKLFTPLKPLYQEFKDIAINEKNRAAIFLRGIAPIIIVLAFIVALTAAMSPLAIPEVLFAFLLIPIIFMGLAVGSAYVSAKNWIRQTCRQLYYGGPFEIPEYQVNNRMLKAFNSREQAQMVRDFYVKEIQQCEQIEKQFALIDKDGTLTDQDIKNRENNTKRFYSLHMEWYDIHSNSRLGNNQIPYVVAGRLNIDIDAEYQKMEFTLIQTDKNTIIESLNNTLLDLKARMLVVTKEEQTPGSSPFSFRSGYSPTLFSPQCRIHQKRAEELDTLARATFATPTF